MYMWESYHEEGCRKLFYKKGKNILKNALYDLREGRTKSGFVFMGEENLDTMLAKWDDPLWQKKREAGKAAQTSTAGRGKAVYPGDSVLTAVHKSRIVSIIISDFFVFCSLLDLKTDK